jgi:RecB family exonuclease
MSDQEQKKKNRVSFSQYSTFLKCPHKWYLDYVKNLRVRDDNIHTAFGTAIHHVLQAYLTALYKEGVGAAADLELNKMFKIKFDEEVDKIRKAGVELSDDDYNEFYYDGEDIIEAFSKQSNRVKYFPAKEFELVGIELPLEISLKNNVDFVGFVDVVLKETNKEKYRIIDIKTSSNGWNKYQKVDESKYAQLHLYKSVYSKKFNVPLDAIDVEFFIVKRKLFADSDFPQNRIQSFVPAHGTMAIKESINNFIGFLDHGFNTDGTYNVDNEYPKVPGNSKKNCKYCKHYKKLCDAKATK